MNTLAKVVTLGALSAFGFTAAAALPEPQAPGDLPWKDIAGGSSTLIMLSALVVVLRFVAQERAARDAERKEERQAREAERRADREHLERLQSHKLSAIEQITTTFREESQASRKLIENLIRQTPP